MVRPGLRILIFFGIPILYLLIFGIILRTAGDEILYTLIKFAGLTGFLSLCFAVIMNLLKSDMRELFGKPFIFIHHLFALSGLFLITIHPMVYVIVYSGPEALLPDLRTPFLFLATLGRVAIVLIYIAFLSSILRRKLKNKWKLIHRLMYPALILAIIHANLSGSTFSQPLIFLIYNLTALVVIGTGVLMFLKRRNKNHPNF